MTVEPSSRAAINISTRTFLPASEIKKIASATSETRHGANALCVSAPIQIADPRAIALKSTKRGSSL
ncbi:MAG: hypothetical protein RLZZ190_197 [Actinomycetota bacterium]|jgi:hypothetical protein